MSSKKLSIKPTSVFATDEWAGKAAYRSLPLRSHAAFDRDLSPLSGQRSSLVRRVLLVTVECTLILGLVIALLLVVVPGASS